MTKILVSQIELQNYLTKRNKQNRIWNFWLDIFYGAKESIKFELKNKGVRLVEVDSDKLKVNGTKPYKFKTHKQADMSPKITDYLGNFVVYVEEE